MHITIREMIRSDAGTYDMGPDIARDLGVSDCTPDHVVSVLNDIAAGPDDCWHVDTSEDWRGWGVVIRDPDGRLYSVEEPSLDDVIMDLRQALSLDELCDRLNALLEYRDGLDDRAYNEARHKIDVALSDLPVYGGEEVDDVDVRSWDETSVLWYDQGVDAWRITRRDDWAL